MPGAVMEREVLRYESQVGVCPTLVILDWLGSVADVAGGTGGTSERATACVKFAEDTGIPTLVLTQAVNDAQLKPVLAINDIGIAKGIAKNVVAVIGVTNSVDMAGVAAAVSGKADMPRSMILEHQFFCFCKARKGEGHDVRRRRRVGGLLRYDHREVA
jgi:hypothetical protein